MMDTDELTQVARLRAEVGSGSELAEAQRLLAAEIAAASGAAARGRAGHRLSPAGGSDRGKHRGRRLAVVGTVAAAVAAAVIVAGLPTHLGPAAVRPPIAHVPGPAASEAELVAYATKAAAAVPPFSPGPHEWVYSKVLAATSANEGGSLQGPITGRHVTQTWTRVDGREQAVLQHGRLYLSGLIGSPEGWKSVSYSYLKSLPTDPVRLRAIIAAEAGPTDANIFDAVQALLENAVALPPRLNAALYGVLAGLPQVRFEPSVTDLADRTGVGLAIVEEGYIRKIIIINSASYAFMGEKSVAIRAHVSIALDGTVHVKKGQVLGWWALLRSGIVRHAGQLP